MKANKNSLAYAPPIIFLLAYTVWWAYIGLHQANNNTIHQDFSGSYGFITLYGIAIGLVVSRKWGGMKSLIGRALAFFALGLLFQEFGQLVYYYYANYRNVAVPYPSIGDLGFFGSIPLYIYGVSLLAKATGSSISLRSVRSKFVAFVIPLVLLSVSYYLFLKGYQFDWHHPLTVFLDFGYPFGQAIYISIAILAFLFSRKLLGGFMRPKILLILFALVAQYSADFTFLYQNHHGTWKAGGINDYMYLVSYFIMTVALVGFHKLPLGSQSKESEPDGR
jgi:hypothetical protein